jgi:hypothetical protein
MQQQDRILIAFCFLPLPDFFMRYGSHWPRPALGYFDVDRSLLACC